MPVFLGARRALSGATAVAGALLDIDLTAAAGGLTCARTSTGTAIDASGSLQSFAANTLRRTSAGMLVEAASTNLALANEDLSSTSWSKSNVGAAASALTSPDGSSKFSLLTCSSTQSANVYVRQSIAHAANTTVAISLFVAFGTAPYAMLGFSDYTANAVTIFVAASNLAVTTSAAGNGSLVGTPSVQAISSGIYRISFLCRFTAAASKYLSIAPCSSTTGAGTSGQTLNAWGAQVEQATAVSSLIPTATATVARAVDTVTLPQSGIGRVVLTFDDNSQQTIGSIDTSTPYALVPANLNRPLIKRLQGFVA